LCSDVVDEGVLVTQAFGLCLLEVIE